MIRLNRIVLTAATVFIMLGLVAVHAQATPNFAGRWVPMDVVRAEALAEVGMTDLPSAGMTITQDARALTVAAPGAGRADSKTFLLDGSKSSNAWGRGGIGVSTARWDGPVLVVTTQGSTLQWINRYSLVGDQLHIEMSGSGSSAVIAYKRVP